MRSLFCLQLEFHFTWPLRVIHEMRSSSHEFLGIPTNWISPPSQLFHGVPLLFPGVPNSLSNNSQNRPRVEIKSMNFDFPGKNMILYEFWAPKKIPWCSEAVSFLNKRPNTKNEKQARPGNDYISRLPHTEKVNSSWMIRYCGNAQPSYDVSFLSITSFHCNIQGHSQDHSIGKNDWQGVERART